MDFYFSNNLLRPDFECFLMQFDSESKAWKACTRGYPHLRVKIDCMGLYMEFYEKNSEINHLNFLITSDVEYEIHENGLVFKTKQFSIAIIFKKLQNVNKFLEIY